MPLFVPILRLAMLFLNIYDTYKTLKIPVSSSRNGGRPSLRALTQRKRAMKGCLSVWIVWCTYTTYERVGEGIISLFIPFYDEIKSIGLLFLILTRARGAEPIFLHVIRPLLKPYTSTIDPALEVFHMIGDFLFALSLFPIQLLMQRWQKMFKTSNESLDSEPEAEHSQHKSETTPPHTDNTATLNATNSDGVTFPKKSRIGNGVRRSSNDSVRGISESSKASNDRKYDIWYPPGSSRVEKDGNNTLDLSTTLSDSTETNATVIYEQVEEWRKYPDFPSAYPPTPITTTSRLIPSDRPNGVDSDIYPPIPEEDIPNQDFLRSLLPPREPLSPGFDGDTSDRDYVPRAHTDNDQDIIMSDTHLDSLSDDYEDEEEDIFDLTLRTPLPLLGSTKSQLYSRMSRISIASSAASHSTTLTSGDNNSSFRTRTSSESSNRSITDSSAVGRKRAYPRSKTSSIKDDLSSLENTEDQEVIKPSISRLNKSIKKRRLSSASSIEIGSETADDIDDTTSPSDENPPSTQIVGEKKVTSPKKRRGTILAPRVAAPSRPIRSRVMRHVSPSLSRPSKPRNVKIPTSPNRASVRLRAARTVPLGVANNASKFSQTSTSSASGNDAAVTRPSRVNRSAMAKKK